MISEKEQWKQSPNFWLLLKVNEFGHFAYVATKVVFLSYLCLWKISTLPTQLVTKEELFGKKGKYCPQPCRVEEDRTKEHHPMRVAMVVTALISHVG